MKTLHYSIIAIFVFSTSIIVMTDAFAQNDTSTHPPLNDLGDGNIFFMVAKGPFLPGQLVEINGNLITVNSIQIVLDDPHGKIVTSKTTFSDRDGYFTSELKIPANATAGIWKIVGTSGIYHKELNFTIAGNSDTVTCYAGNLCSTPIANTTVQYGPRLVASTVINSPLQQFKSGISGYDIKCNQGFQLIFKAENGSPACVKPDSGNKLIALGWAVAAFSHSTSVEPFDTLKMNVIGTDLSFNYTILGGQLENAIADIQNESLDLSLKTTENGTLIVILPRGLIDSKIHEQDSPFIIMEDGREVKYQQTDSTITNRMLLIPFQYGVSKLEIIAPEPIR